MAGVPHDGLGFFTGTRWAPNADVFGSLAFVYGTLLVSAIALVFAVPVSIGIALFLSEVAPRRLRRPVIYLVDLLAAVPSVVYGLWGVIVLAPSSPASTTPWATHLARSRFSNLFFGRPVHGPGPLHRRAHPRPHDHADHHVDHP